MATINGLPDSGPEPVIRIANNRLSPRLAMLWLIKNHGFDAVAEAVNVTGTGEARPVYVLGEIRYQDGLQ